MNSKCKKGLLIMEGNIIKAAISDVEYKLVVRWVNNTLELINIAGNEPIDKIVITEVIKSETD